MAYKNNTAVMKSSTEEVYVGNYGSEWLEFMHSNHPDLVEQMIENNSLMAVAQSVDDRAWKYRELLDTQYAKCHPRPTKYEDVVRWEKTRMFYTDGEVMRDKVLVVVTQP